MVPTSLPFYLSLLLLLFNLASSSADVVPNTNDQSCVDCNKCPYLCQKTSPPPPPPSQVGSGLPIYGAPPPPSPQGQANCPPGQANEPNVFTTPPPPSTYTYLPNDGHYAASITFTVFSFAFLVLSFSIVLF